MGARVTVLTVTPARAHRAIASQQPGVDVRTFPVLRDSAGYVRGYLNYATFDLPLALRLLFLRRPDVVVSEPPPTTGLVVRSVCWARRIPYVYYAADIWSDAAGAAAAPDSVVRALAVVERLAVRGAVCVLSVGQACTERLGRWRQEGIVTIGHGVDTDMYQERGAVQRLPGPYFLYAGTASEVHGATIFVDALSLVLRQRPDVRLVFIGQGTDFPVLREVAGSLPAGALTVLPRIPAYDVAPWLRGAVASLASVRPGVNYDYAVPTKSYSSLACGCPVILAGPSPLAEAVDENGLGWAVDYDAEAIGAAMLDALRADRRERFDIAAWARTNVSARTVSGRAAKQVLNAIDRGHA
jgi:glycosyltransferase involved in cell wall biosynthesis